MRNKRLISTAASLFVLVQCGALGHAGEDDLNDRGSEKSFAWLQSRCQQGGGWRSSSLPEPPYFTRIPVETFYRAAACSVAVPSLIFVSMDDQAEDVHAWTNAAAMVREQEQLAQPREGSGWRQGAPYPNELTLGILADLTGPSARDLARSLRLPADASAVLLAAFSTNDHAEGLVFLALPVLTHQTAPTETRCEDEKADTLSCVAMRLAKALAPTYHAHNVALHLHSLIQKPSCLQQPDHQEYAGDSDFRTTTSATATQSSSSSREDLRCIWGAAVTVLAQGSWPPPRRIPASLLPRFSMNGSVPIHYADSYRWEQSGVRGSGRSGRCFARGQGGLVCRPTEYQQEHIQALQAQAKAQVPGYYVDTDVFLFKVLDMLGGQTAFEGLRVGVIGSVEPWYEAICLAYGAAECVSIDYNAVHYRHSRLSWMSVEELTKGVTQEDHQLPHNATRT